MKANRLTKLFLIIGLLIFGFLKSAVAQEAWEQTDEPSVREEAPLRSDQYPQNEYLTNQYPYYDPDTKLNSSQFPYYDSSTGFFIPGAFQKQDPNWPVDQSVTIPFPYYDASSKFFIYGPLESVDPLLPIPDPDAMPMHVDYAPPNTDGWEVDQPKWNRSEPNVSTPNLPNPNIAQPNVDIYGY